MLAQEKLINKSSLKDSVKLKSKINHLIDELKKIEDVSDVRAIIPNYHDLFSIEFEIKLNSEADLPDDSWEKIQKLVLAHEWQLRDETHKSWYFDVEFVNYFYELKGDTQLIT